MSYRFDSLYSQGFIRVAAAVPSVRIADPESNARSILALAERASAQHTALLSFPELSLSAYSNDDLFQQEVLLLSVLSSLQTLVEASRELSPVLVVGAPVRVDSQLFNCAIVLYRGAILGVVPKSYLPNYREFYEKRQFSAAREATAQQLTLCGQTVPFGDRLLFSAENVPGFALGVEICEDLWTPLPPSSFAALAGATVLVNLSASNITVAKAEYRRALCAMQSARCIAAYLYADAGPGESTTDVAWDGQAMVYENFELLAESERFAREEQLITADIDLDRLVQERCRVTSFHDAILDHSDRVRAYRKIDFGFELPKGTVKLARTIERFPYVPSDPATLDDRCSEAFHIQVEGLTQRLISTGVQKVVIGVSGGLDSTHALLVAARAVKLMGLPRSNILAYTLPGFATSESTLCNAKELMARLKVSAEEIDIRPACMQMLKDIGHPYAEGKPVYDVTFENVQAGERTSHLFRLANLNNAMVLGTGDLSELALGWCTYGVGDQMSHYNVNSSVPKTLIRYLIRWVIGSGQFDKETGKVLQAVLDTVVSPELVPGENGGGPAQSTEEAIGPYELQDFHLFYISRYGLRPSKVAYLCHHAWQDRDLGPWPALLPGEDRRQYTLPEIRHWLELFLYRFFQISQFKRTAMPNGPKVGSGGSLSPRGDWRAPSDATADMWLQELRAHVPGEDETRG